MGDGAEIWKCPQCGECLDISASGFYSEVVCPNCANRTYVHTRLANFQLEGVLGIGGMSVVLRAKDLILNRPLAIKVLNDTYRDQPERIARFEKECAMMARVRHENVVSVYSAGRARGQFYIAMELIQGTNLESIVTGEGPMPPIRVMDVAREIILGLQAAHKAGLLHRDMKPGNVIIDSNGKARVLDFGLALSHKSADTEAVIWATPYYVPPETLQREAEDVRTDIYALGMSLRFLLTGEHELKGDDSTLPSMLKAKRNLPPLGQISPQTPSAVAKLVDRMTAFKPSDRPASYTTLLEEVDTVRGILRDGEAAKTPARKMRRFLLWAGGILGVLAVGAGGAMLTAKLTTPPAQQDYLECAHYRDRSDLALMDSAMKAVEAGDWGEASSALDKLGKEAAEPTLGAVASLLRVYISLSEGKPAELGAGMEHFRCHIQREKEASPAAASLFEQIRKAGGVVNSLDRTGIPDTVTAPELRAVLSALQARRLALLGEAEAAATALSHAEEEFAKADPRYVRFGELLPAVRGYIEGLQQAGFNERVSGCMAVHDFTTAERLLAKRLGEGDAISDEERAKLLALKEICQVGRGVVKVFRARIPGGYVPGMPAEDMKALATRISEDGWAEEVYALGLLLKGEGTAAMEADPYRQDPESTKPFARLMRGWKASLRL